jgi:peptidyl-prolyl cis-trans isomerase SurA
MLSGAAVAQTTPPGDFIVAVVDAVPITNHEVRSEVQRVKEQLTQQRRPVPPDAELRAQVLEQLINARAQLQFAQETGIRIDDSAVDLAEQSIANQNDLDLQGLHQRLAKEGVDVSTFRTQLREQLTLTRLRERDVQARMTVSDIDVERAIQEQQANNTDPLTQDINLAQLLVAVPDKATGDQVAKLYAQAQKLLARIRAGESFEDIVKEVSAADRSNGGQMGLRRADRYPTLFLQAALELPVGGVSEIVRSGAGFHILKMVDKRAPTRLIKTMVQTRARHILLRATGTSAQTAAISKLTALRAQIAAGKTTFQNVAREVSQDGSAADGGDLGWASPGMFVPEFEETMNRLNEGDMSNPIVSRFGVHLIQVVERRRVELTPQQLRESVRNQLRESRYEEALANWARDIRARAFVEMREPPQ